MSTSPFTIHRDPFQSHIIGDRCSPSRQAIKDPTKFPEHRVPRWTGYCVVRGCSCTRGCPCAVVCTAINLLFIHSSATTKSTEQAEAEWAYKFFFFFLNIIAIVIILHVTDTDLIHNHWVLTKYCARSQHREIKPLSHCLSNHCAVMAQYWFDINAQFPHSAAGVRSGQVFTQYRSLALMLPLAPLY